MTDLDPSRFGRPDDTGDPDTQWSPHREGAYPPEPQGVAYQDAAAYPDGPPTEPLFAERWPASPPTDDDNPGWKERGRGWSAYGGAERRPTDPRTMLVATGLVAALVGGAVGAGTAWLVSDRREKASVTDASASLGTGVSTPRDTTPGSVAEIARNVVPVVVNIDVLTSGGGGNGSGVIIRNDGYIVTNNHVVEDATSLNVTMADGTSAAATVVGTDPDTDLAVIKVRATGLPVATMGRSNNIQVGDPVVAVGSPLGLQGTVTSGIVSALNRSLDIPARGGNGPVVLVNAIQTDAAINPGNSGGALVDRTGKLIGINSAIASTGGAFGGSGGSIGVGFAIPIDEARAVAEEIIRTGRATHPYLGITGNDLTPQTARQFGLKTESGAILMEVTQGGPAEGAGLRPRDIIVRLGGDKVTSMGDLIGAIRSHRVDEAVDVTYIRDGSQKTVRVTLRQKPR
jgi:putative serine protease PepD